MKDAVVALLHVLSLSLVSWAGEKVRVYDRDYRLRYIYDVDRGKVFNKNYELKFRVENNRVYDKDYRVRYICDKDRGRVYDTNYRLKYRVEGNRVYDRDYRRLYNLESR